MFKNESCTHVPKMTDHVSLCQTLHELTFTTQRGNVTSLSMAECRHYPAFRPFAFFRMVILKWWLFLLLSNNWWKLCFNTCIFILLYGLSIQHLMANVNMMDWKRNLKLTSPWPRVTIWKIPAKVSIGNSGHLLDCLSELERLQLWVSLPSHIWRNIFEVQWCGVS